MMARGRDVSSFYPFVLRNSASPSLVSSAAAGPGGKGGALPGSLELKKHTYSFLVANADANASCRELSLLAINSFQRDLADSSPLVRALALRVLCSIRAAEVGPIQTLALRKACSDSSPFVRKSAAHCCGKVLASAGQGEDAAGTKAEITACVDRLLGDKTTAVLSSAIAAFNECCPEVSSLSLLHKHYRSLCSLLADFDEWGQTQALVALTRYARAFFTNPEPEDRKKAEKDKKEAKGGKKSGKSKKDDKKSKKKSKKGKGFYSEDEDSSSDSDSEDSSSSDDSSSDESEDSLVPHLSEDHSLLLRVSLPLLRSRNTGVVLAVAALHHYAGPRDRAVQGRVGRALVRIMRGPHREQQYLVLSSLVVFAKSNPDLFRRYIKDFFIHVSNNNYNKKGRVACWSWIYFHLFPSFPFAFFPFLFLLLQESEPSFVRLMKLEVLTSLASSDTVGAILHEFGRYVRDDDKGFVKAVIQSIVRIAIALPDVADRCLKGLMALVGTDSESVVAEAVVAIRQLLQQRPEQHEGIIVRLARKLGNSSLTASPSARAAIVWVLGEFQHKPRVAMMAPDALRLLAKGFKNEAPEVKLQILSLAAKTALRQPASQPVQLLLRYCLELARYDPSSMDLRDRARLLRSLLLSPEAAGSWAQEANEEAGSVIASKAPSASADAAADMSAAEAAAALAEAAAAAAERGEGEGGAADAGSASNPNPSPSPRIVGLSSPASASGRFSIVGLGSGAAATASSAGASSSVKMQDRVRAVLLAAKPPPSIEFDPSLLQYTSVSSSSSSSTAASDGSSPAAAVVGSAATAPASFMLGSLSFMVGHAARGYQPLPEWATEESDPHLRDPPKDDDDSEEEGGRKKRGKKRPFAPESSSEDDSSSDDDDSSSDDDDDDSSDEDDDATSSSEDDEEESSEEEEESSEDDDSEDDAKAKTKAKAKKSTTAAAVAATKKSRLVAGEDSEEDEESDEEEESSEEEEEESSEEESSEEESSEEEDDE